MLDNNNLVINTALKSKMWCFPTQNGQKLSSSTRFHMEYSEGKCILLIDGVTAEDEGEYTCEARNEHGVASSTAQLLIDRRHNDHNSCISLSNQ